MYENMDNKLLENSLHDILGQFMPTNLGSRLFMERTKLETADKFLVWFHERFHYLQMVFTPYGHLKWGAYRTSTTDIVDTWVKLSDYLKQPKKIPIREYILGDSRDGLRLAYNIWLYDLGNEIYRIVEQGATSYNSIELFHKFTYDTCCPIITLMGQRYRFRGIDVLESFAKFEETMLGEIITEKSLDEFIDPDKLNPEYYSALYYFVETIGVNRLIEFPIVCEIALATAHIPSFCSLDEFYKNAPNWRFVKIVEKIKDLNNLPTIDFKDNNSFYNYVNVVLDLCGFEMFDRSWESAEKYEDMSELTMAKEMKMAIEYKKKHPWMLAYPMYNEEDFFSEEFNRFEPYFTIMNDGVSYNSEYISSEELMFENHLQALAQQICGYCSDYCRDPFKIMCGYTYMGLNTCKHYLYNECDGHIDCNTQLPKIVLDEKSNIKEGCTFDMCLKMQGIDIKNVQVGFIQKIKYDELKRALDKNFKENT